MRKEFNQFSEKLETINMENIYTVSKPLLKVAELLGFFPMHFVGPSKVGNLQLSWFGVLMSICLILTNAIIFAKVMTTRSFVMTDSEILSKAFDILTKTEHLTYFLLIGYQMKKCKNVVKFLKLLHSFDEKVRNSLN